MSCPSPGTLLTEGRRHRLYYLQDEARLTGLLQACQSAIGSAEYYDHSKTPEWNSTIIVSCHCLSLAGPLALQGSNY